MLSEIRNAPDMAVARTSSERLHFLSADYLIKIPNYFKIEVSMHATSSTMQLSCDAMAWAMQVFSQGRPAAGLPVSLCCVRSLTVPAAGTRAL
jgi:hypothetical protein